jgi:hypothetical protein
LRVCADDAGYLIALNELLPDPDQPRKYLDPAALTEMVKSIKEHGIIRLAKKCSKSKTTISSTLSINKLPPEVWPC